MNEKDLKILWKIMKEGDPDYPNWTPVPNFPDYPTFKSKMSTPELRNRFYLKNYAALVKGKIFSNDWTAVDFEAKYGPQNTNTPSPTTTTKKTPAPTKEEICNGKVVSEGMKGNTVWMIQDKLSRIGLFKKNLTNNFGTETKKAVVNFQNKNKLSVDGKVGPDTWNLLFQGTDNACKKVENKPTEVKPTEVKPTEVMPTKIDEPNKMKKIPIPAGVTYREKYTGKIKEQVQPPIPGSLENSVNKIVDPKTILKRVIRTGCIDTLKKEIGFELIGQPESQPAKIGEKFAIIGFNQNDFEYVYLFSDGTGQKQKVDKDYKPLSNQVEEFDWECPQLTKSTSVTSDETKMSVDQAEYVQDMVSRGKFQVTKPSDYETNQGKWEWIDLHTLNPGLFNEKNKFFVYQQSGLMGKLTNQYPNIEKVLNQTFWTFNEPDINTEAYSTRRDIGTQFPKYAEKFPKGLPIYYTGTTRSTKEQKIVSDLVTAIEKNKDSIEGKTCRDSVNVLYDAFQNYRNGVIYFPDDTALELVRAYVQRCRKNYGNTFNRILAGGAKNKYDFLNRRRSGPSGELKFLVGEQKDNLSSLIKKKLVEAKTKKETDTVGKQLIENKLKMIVKSVRRQGNILKK